MPKSTFIKVLLPEPAPGRGTERRPAAHIIASEGLVASQQLEKWLGPPPPAGDSVSIAEIQKRRAQVKRLLIPRATPSTSVWGRPA